MTDLTSDQFNARYPVGTLVAAYPGVRPETDPTATVIVGATRSTATVLGGHTDVVWVDGHSACIALSHIDPICGSRCTKPGHDHVCLRSPRHQAGICRDRKQKNTQNCTWDGGTR